MALQSDVVDTISAVDENQWNNVVSQSGRRSVFHRAEWQRAIEEGLPAEPRHALVSKNGNPVALLPTFARSLDVPVGGELARALGCRELVSTHPGYGGPLIVGDTSECLSSLLEAVRSASRPGTVHHTIRTDDPAYTQYGKSLVQSGFSPQIFGCRIQIDLGRGWTDVEAGMRKERRNALRQARERSHQIREEPLDNESLRGVYDNYLANMDRAGGDAFPFSFFTSLAEHVADRLMVSTAVVEDSDVGTFVFLLDDERSTVRYFFSAIGDEADYEYYPTELLHEHAMKWGIENGYDYYDFGETPADFSNGQFRYKRKYGGEIVPTIHWQRGQSWLLWPAFRAGRAMYWKTKR